MRTDELISMLATGETAADLRALQRRYVIALGWGAFGSALLMAVLLGVRPDLFQAAELPMFWVKLAFPAAILAGALMAATRLSRPGASTGGSLLVIAAPVLAMWLIAIAVLLGAAPAERAELVLGDTWSECLVNVTALSVPVFASVFWAMKGLAPTRLGLSGAAAGLVAGALGALIYALHCPEMAAPFLGIWYLAGMLIPTTAGALLGPRLLRW